MDSKDLQRIRTRIQLWSLSKGWNHGAISAFIQKVDDSQYKNFSASYWTVESTISKFSSHDHMNVPQIQLSCAALAMKCATRRETGNLECWSTQMTGGKYEGIRKCQVHEVHLPCTSASASVKRTKYISCVQSI